MKRQKTLRKPKVIGELWHLLWHASNTLPAKQNLCMGIQRTGAFLRAKGGHIKYSFGLHSVRKGNFLTEDLCCCLILLPVQAGSRIKQHKARGPELTLKTLQYGPWDGFGKCWGHKFWTFNCIFICFLSFFFLLIKTSLKHSYYI